jgi:hypothetical protein
LFETNDTLPGSLGPATSGYGGVGGLSSYSATEFNVFMSLSLNASSNGAPHNVSEGG